MKKSVLLLLLISLALLASSCLGSPAAGISLATGETTNDSSEDDTLVTFIKDGKTDYVIVAPLGCPSVISETANNMKGFCYNLHSVHFWVKYDKNYNETPYEILIGKTDRAESDTVISTLGKYEYAIRFVGNKLVIGGGSAVATEYAAKIFTEQYITADNPLFSVPRDINITGSMPAVSDKLSAGWNLQYFDAANGKTLPYSIYIPSGFDINKEYALFVYMHGLGNNGDDGVSQTKVVSSEILN